jgi:transcriptional regulator with XRE-family HTH domain
MRMRAGLSIDAVATELLCSASKVSRLETGNRPANPRDVRDLCRLYAVPDDEAHQLMELARQARETAWWQQETSITKESSTYIGLERDARAILSSHNLAVTGLLQTPDYARALLSGVRVQGSFSPDEIERRVRVRQLRQDLLDLPDAPRLHVVLDESVLVRPVGSPSIMAHQLEFLASAAKKPNVRIQVIPFSAGAHPGLDGRFVVLELASAAVADVVYIEGLLGELFLDRPADVARYKDIFEYLCTHVALDEDRSQAFLLESRASWARHGVA